MKYTLLLLIIALCGCGDSFEKGADTRSDERVRAVLAYDYYAHNLIGVFTVKTNRKWIDFQDNGIYDSYGDEQESASTVVNFKNTTTFTLTFSVSIDGVYYSVIDCLPGTTISFGKISDSFNAFENVDLYITSDIIYSSNG